MNTTNNKKDYLDRKIDGLRTIFGLAERDFMALMLTLSLLLNLAQYYDVRRTERVLNDEIKEEIRRQAVPAIRRETSDQLKPIKTELDTVISRAKEKLNY